MRLRASFLLLITLGCFFQGCVCVCDPIVQPPLQNILFNHPNWEGTLTSNNINSVFDAENCRDGICSFIDLNLNTGENTYALTYVITPWNDEGQILEGTQTGKFAFYSAFECTGCIDQDNNEGQLIFYPEEGEHYFANYEFPINSGDQLMPIINSFVRISGFEIEGGTLDLNFTL